MKPSVVCHIGLHKTASGTLQRQFFPACDEVELFTTQDRATDEFIQAVTCTDPIYFDPARARSLLEARLTSERVNLLSNESLSGPPYAGLIEYGLDHRDAVLRNLHAVFPDARIVIVLRRQDSLARSLYRQYLKRGGTERIDRFYGMSRNRRAPLMSLNRFRYLPYLERIESLFPSGLKVLLFEDFVAQRGRFLADLCDFVGIACPTIDLRVENATKLGAVGMEVSRWSNFLFRSMINKGPLPAVPRKQFNKWRRVSPVEYFHDYWPGRGKPGSMTNFVCSRILDAAKDENRALEERFRAGLGDKGYY